MLSSTERFSDRADAYAKYRPRYAALMFHWIRERVPISSTVADIGSGTGILTLQLIEAGYHVIAVEPNGPMRAAAEAALIGVPNFRSVNGTAETTTLEAGSVGLITCAQAFHWFNQEKTKPEFRRILAPDGAVAIIWNHRAEKHSDFNRQYAEILERGAAEYGKVRNRVSRSELQAFFSPASVEFALFPNDQTLSREGLLGRVLSSSYVPNEGKPGHEEIIKQFEELFDRFQMDGFVTINYETEICLCRGFKGSSED